MKTITINKWLEDLLEEFREELIKKEKESAKIFQKDVFLTKEEKVKYLDGIRREIEGIKIMSEIDLIQRAVCYQIYDMKEERNNE